MVCEEVGYTSPAQQQEMQTARVTDSNVGPEDKPASGHLAKRHEELEESMDTVSLLTALEPKRDILPNKDTHESLVVDVD